MCFQFRTASLSFLGLLLAIHLFAGAADTRASTATPCAPADSEATANRDYLQQFFQRDGYGGARVAMNMTTVPADSIVQVSDSTVCANALAAIINVHNGASLHGPVYTFRAGQYIVVAFPAPSANMPYSSSAYFFTDSLQYLGAVDR